MKLEFKRITGTSELYSNLKPWMQLIEGSGQTSIFHHPLWHKAWWESYGKNYDMDVLVAMEKERWVGILPLARICSLGITTLEFSGSSQADLHDVVALPGYLNSVLELFRAPFEQKRRRVDTVVLHALSADTPLLTWADLENKKCIVKTEASPYIPTRHLHYEEIEQTWSKSHRGDVRRQIRRLQGIGKLTLGLISDQGKAEKYLASWQRAQADFVNYKRRAEQEKDELGRIEEEICK